MKESSRGTKSENRWFWVLNLLDVSINRYLNHAKRLIPEHFSTNHEIRPKKQASKKLEKVRKDFWESEKLTKFGSAYSKSVVNYPNLQKRQKHENSGICKKLEKSWKIVVRMNSSKYDKNTLFPLTSDSDALSKFGQNGKRKISTENGTEIKKVVW